jgi:DNA-binding GntR family transcriptional regulator
VSAPPHAVRRVMEVLGTQTRHLTVAGLADSAQVSRTTVRQVLGELDAEGKLDIRRDWWPHGYLLTEQART